MFLVHNDQAQVRYRRKHRGTSADDNGPPALADVPPGIVALAFRKRTVNDGNPAAEMGPEAAHRLRRERNLRYQNQRAKTVSQNAVNGPDVDPRLAAPGNPVQEKGIEPWGVERIPNFLQCSLLMVGGRESFRRSGFHRRVWIPAHLPLVDSNQLSARKRFEDAVSDSRTDQFRGRHSPAACPKALETFSLPGRPALQRGPFDFEPPGIGHQLNHALLQGLDTGVFDGLPGCQQAPANQSVYGTAHPIAAQATLQLAEAGRTARLKVVENLLLKGGNRTGIGAVERGNGYALSAVRMDTGRKRGRKHFGQRADIVSRHPSA